MTNITSHSSQAKVKCLTECVYKNHDNNVVKNCWAKQILCNKTINKSIKSKKSSNSPSSQFHLYTYVWYMHSGIVYWIPSHIHSTWVLAAIKSMYLRKCLFMYEEHEQTLVMIFLFQFIASHPKYPNPCKPNPPQCQNITRTNFCIKVHHVSLLNLLRNWLLGCPQTCSSWPESPSWLFSHPVV